MCIRDRYTGQPLEQPQAQLYVNGRLLVLGEDYEIAYFDNISPGTATVQYRLQGHYDGVITQTYRIYSAEEGVPFPSLPDGAFPDWGQTETQPQNPHTGDSRGIGTIFLMAIVSGYTLLRCKRR